VLIMGRKPQLDGAQRDELIAALAAGGKSQRALAAVLVWREH
jgi:hypothetical protein